MSRLSFRPLRRPPSPRADYIRLILMGTVLIVLLMVIFNPNLLYRAGLPEERPVATHPAPPPPSVRIVWVPTTQADTPPAATRPAATEPARPWPGAEAVGLPLGIDRAILNDVHDLERIEVGPYFEALKAVADLPPAAFAQAGLPKVTLPDLVTSPVLFRGRLVTVTGNLRRLDEQPLGTNPAGLDRVYVALIRDPRSIDYTYTVVLVEAPGAEAVVGRDVTAAGIFFKVAVSPDGTGTLRQTPLLMGRRLQLLGPPYPEQHRVPVVLGTVVGLALLLILVVAVLWYRRGDRRFYRRFLTPRGAPPTDFGNQEAPDDQAEPTPEGRDDGDQQP